MQKAKRTTPIPERAAKVGVVLKPTPTGVRAVLADDGASPAACTRAKTALRAHQMAAVLKVTRAEKRALEQPAPAQQQQRRSKVPMQERAAAAGIELPAESDTSAAGGSDEAKAALRKHQKVLRQKVARAEQQVISYLIRLNRFEGKKIKRSRSTRRRSTRRRSTRRRSTRRRLTRRRSTRRRTTQLQTAQKFEEQRQRIQDEQRQRIRLKLEQWRLEFDGEANDEDFEYDSSDECMEDLIHSRMEAAAKMREREREREQQLRAQGGFRAWLYDRKQLWKRMREERKEEKRRAAQRKEEERWQEAEFLRRQARATEEARVEALMRGEAAPSQSIAEQILKYGPKMAILVAHDVRRRAAELAEWDEDDKAGELPGFHRSLTNLTRNFFWNQSIVWVRGGGGGGLTPMQRAEAQQEDYRRRLAAWKANGSPLDSEQAARARHDCFDIPKGRNRDLLSAARKAESWVAAVIEEFRATWAPRTTAALKEWGPPDFGASDGSFVPRLIHAGGVPLLLPYTPLLVPLLDQSDGPVPWDSIPLSGLH